MDTVQKQTMLRCNLKTNLVQYMRRDWYYGRVPAAALDCTAPSSSVCWCKGWPNQDSCCTLYPPVM